jgi:hypothetical protein
MDADERENLIRQYADGETTWLELRMRGLNVEARRHGRAIPRNAYRRSGKRSVQADRKRHVTPIHLGACERAKCFVPQSPRKLNGS